MNKLESSFYLPPAYVSNHLSKYYILHWSGSYLQAQLNEAPKNMILHRDTLYKIILLNQEPINLTSQYKISFRLEKYMHQGIALAKEIV